MAIEATEQDTKVRQCLEELRGELLHKVVVLQEMAEIEQHSAEKARLDGKAQGMSMAASFVDQTIREGRWRE